MINDWKILTLGEIAEIKRGLPSQDLNYVESELDGVRLIRINDFKSDSPKFIKETDKTKKLTIRKGDVLIAGTGATAGISFLADDLWDGLPFSYNAPRIRVKKGNSSTFVYFILNSEKIKKQQNKLFTGNAQPFLDTRAIASFNIPVPPLPEQQKIAEILSTVDDKIEVIEQQIIENQALKKGLMQRLLTKGIGHAEFKDSSLGKIPMSWKIVKLAEIGDFFKGKGISKSEILRDGQFPCIRYGEIYTFYDTIIHKFQSFINQESANNSNSFISGDLLFTSSGETAEDIGKCVTYIGNEQPYASGDLIIHRPNKGDSRFLSYCMNSSIIRNQTKKLGQGNAVVHIYTKHLSQLTFPFPQVEEQTQIAKILCTIDEKLAVLSEKKTQYKELKQGLMQQLLTGKIRVKV